MGHRRRWSSGRRAERRGTSRKTILELPKDKASHNFADLWAHGVAECGDALSAIHPLPSDRFGKARKPRSPFRADVALTRTSTFMPRLSRGRPIQGG